MSRNPLGDTTQGAGDDRNTVGGGTSGGDTSDGGSVGDDRNQTSGSGGRDRDDDDDDGGGSRNPLGDTTQGAADDRQQTRTETTRTDVDSGGVVDRVTDVAGDVGASVGNTVDTIRSGTTSRLDNLSQRASTTVERVAATTTGAVNTVGTRVDRVADTTGDQATDTVSDVQTRAAALADGATTGARNTVQRQQQNIDTDITDDLTRGGVFSETADSDDGLVSGSYEGVTPEGPADVDVSEESFRERSQAIDQSAEDTFGSNPELTVAGSDLPDRVITGGANAAVDVVNVPGLITSGETAVEVATNAPGEVREEGAGAVGATALGVGAAAAGATARSAAENPAGFAGGAAFNVVSGAGAGRQLGRVGRTARDRTRTAGGTEIDATDLASDDVVRFTETDGAEGTQFPGADNPEQFRTDPAAAVREQADATTPPQITDTFDEAGVDEGTTLTKALDVEPEGPAAGRADAGFQSAPGESLAEFDYETPGSFFGPELSPNFLRVGRQDAGFSLRPGLPDTGNNPTAVLARTDVENPDADTLEGFNRELIERRGETTARPKPADEVNPGEIEAVVPPGAQFEPVGGGGILGQAGSRAGVGSEFFTEIGGRRVPLRTVAPESSGRRDGPEVDTNTTGSGRTRGGAQSLDELSEGVDRPVDRPIAGFGSGGGGSSASATNTTTGGVTTSLGGSGGRDTTTGGSDTGGVFGGGGGSTSGSDTGGVFGGGGSATTDLVTASTALGGSEPTALATGDYPAAVAVRATCAAARTTATINSDINAPPSSAPTVPAAVSPIASVLGNWNTNNTTTAAWCVRGQSRSSIHTRSCGRPKSMRPPASHAADSQILRNLSTSPRCARHGTDHDAPPPLFPSSEPFFQTWEKTTHTH